MTNNDKLIKQVRELNDFHLGQFFVSALGRETAEQIVLEHLSSPFVEPLETTAGLKWVYDIKHNKLLEYYCREINSAVDTD